MGDPKPTVSESAVRSAVHGSSASLVTTSAQPAFVIVQDGQTLWAIAQTYGVSVDLPVGCNEKLDGDALRRGDRLRGLVASTDTARRTDGSCRATAAVAS